MSEAARHTRTTVFIVAGVYVGIGFFIAVPAALRGDPLSAFLGFIIISGALAGAVALNALLRLGMHLLEASDAIEDVRKTLERLERHGSAPSASGTDPCGTGFQPVKEKGYRPIPPTAQTTVEDAGCEPIPLTKSVPQSTAMIDLTAFGDGNPTVLTAAMLDRDVFPRLVTVMGETSSPPADIAPTADEPSSDGPSDSAETPGDSGEAPSEDNLAQHLWHGPMGHRSSTAEGDEQQDRTVHTDANIPTGLTTRNLLRVWRVALRDGDLQTCRSVFSTLVDTVDPERLTPLQTLLQDLTDRTEQSLRKTFAECVGMKDYAGALHIGEQICTLLPDHGITDDFHQIKPRLARLRSEQQATTAPEVAIVR